MSLDHLHEIHTGERASLSPVWITLPSMNQLWIVTKVSTSCNIIATINLLLLHHHQQPARISLRTFEIMSMIVPRFVVGRVVRRELMSTDRHSENNWLWDLDIFRDLLWNAPTHNSGWTRLHFWPCSALEGSEKKTWKKPLEVLTIWTGMEIMESAQCQIAALCKIKRAINLVSH